MTAAQINFEDVLTQLEALGNERRKEISIKNGAPKNQFGTGMTDIRKLAKKIKRNHELAMKLWDTGNLDAMILATMCMDAKKLSKEGIEEMLKHITYLKLIDEFIFTLVSHSTFSEELESKWIDSSDEFIGRAGWNIIISKVIKGAETNFDVNELLARIENEIKAAPKAKQESMNSCLVEIGVHFSKYTERCINIGEKIGKLDDRPVPKGCTSAFAPEWINAVLRRAAKQ